MGEKEMGLDIHLYRRDKKRKRISKKKAVKELIELLNESQIPEIRKLKEYSEYIEKPLIECLQEAINNYAEEIPGGTKSIKVCHCHGLWSILCMFKDYNNSGVNRVLKEDEYNELSGMVQNALIDVEKHFKEQGYEITKSPILTTFNNLSLFKDGKHFDVIIRGNFEDEIHDKVDHRLEFEANEVCWKKFYFYDIDPFTGQQTVKRYDPWIYDRLIHLHHDFVNIDHNTDFNTQEIVMNADW